jgi:hypothetical protein
MTFDTDFPVNNEEGNERPNCKWKGTALQTRIVNDLILNQCRFTTKKKKKRPSPRIHSTPTKSQKDKQRQTTLTLLSPTIQLIYVIWQTRESHIQTETPTILCSPPNDIAYTMIAFAIPPIETPRISKFILPNPPMLSSPSKRPDQEKHQSQLP